MSCNLLEIRADSQQQPAETGLSKTRELIMTAGD